MTQMIELQDKDCYGLNCVLLPSSSYVEALNHTVTLFGMEFLVIW